MAARRKTKAELKATGAFLRNPKRRVGRGDPPKPTGELGPPPDHLSRDEKAIWFELAGILPPGVAANVDRFAIETLVVLWTKTRKKTATMSERRLLLSLLGKFGMTPADRRRIEVRDQSPDPAEGKTKDGWDRLFEGGKKNTQ